MRAAICFLLIGGCNALLDSSDYIATRDATFAPDALSRDAASVADGGTLDGGAQDATLDAGPDASVSDAGTPEDTGTDAVVAPDAGADAGGCVASVPTGCCDDDLDCPEIVIMGATRRLRCLGVDCGLGVAGVCVPPAPPGLCHVDADCAGGMTCPLDFDPVCPTMDAPPMPVMCL